MVTRDLLEVVEHLRAEATATCVGVGVDLDERLLEVVPQADEALTHGHHRAVDGPGERQVALAVALGDELRPHLLEPHRHRVRPTVLLRGDEGVVPGLHRDVVTGVEGFDPHGVSSFFCISWICSTGPKPRRTLTRFIAVLTSALPVRTVRHAGKRSRSLRWLVALSRRPSRWPRWAGRTMVAPWKPRSGACPLTIASVTPTTSP